MHDDLKVLLQTHIMKPKKVQLGVIDPKLGASINEALGINCTHIGAVPEITRGNHLSVSFSYLLAISIF